MKFVIFYSWQSDLPNNTNWTFIELALKAAAKVLRSDPEIEDEIIIDRDTAGTPGSPHIVETILAKISAADVFVADVSIVAKTSNNKGVPNPSVMLELGYAYKALGEDRVITIINKAFGGIEYLPFDIKHRRVMPYNSPEDASDRAIERKRLTGKIERALRTILDTLPREAPGAVVEPEQLSG